MVGLSCVLTYHLTNNHRLVLEDGIIYWHFVDVVWLSFFLYLCTIEDINGSSCTKPIKGDSSQHNGYYVKLKKINYHILG